MGGSPGGGNPWGIPDVQSLFPGVPVPRHGVAGGMDPGGMAGGNMGEQLPPGVSISDPEPLEPWNYRVPNPQIPEPGGQGNWGVAGGRGRGRRRKRRQERQRGRFWDSVRSNEQPNRFWDKSAPMQR